jgi:two-component system CheB/CheR fusion protein
VTGDGTAEVTPAEQMRPPGPALVVGIGSSAGGLEALQDLFGGLSIGGEECYIVAQHLSPDRRSVLVDLLARETGLSVIEAQDGLELEPGVVYIGPPNTDVSVKASTLLVKPTGSAFGPNPNIDLLLGSIADQWGPRAVGVVLSGTGSDGAHGLRALRAAGGLTFVQLPESAKFDSMPRAAIALGGADLVLSAGEIGVRLGAMVGSHSGLAGDALPAAAGPVLRRIVTQIQKATGNDFSRYKESTLRRQVSRRMAMRQVSETEDYLPLLVADSEEARALSQNILVTVTAFFRDAEAFKALEVRLRDYVELRLSDEQLRVWVPGCATGEEVYSIAMIIDEILGHPVDLPARLKIFGTDLDETSLSIARRGLYSASAIEKVDPDRRTRYLTEVVNGYEIAQDLRECAVFARHNVGEDPPFPRLDLVSCRNTMIYFTTPLQERVAELVSYALLPGGLLFLGVSESIPPAVSGFAVVDAAHRIYVRGIQTTSPFPATRRQLPPSETRRSAPTAQIAVVRDTIPEQHVTLLESLVRSVASPCMVLDENGDLVEVVGDVSPYCQIPEGRASKAAVAILNPLLQAEARALVLMTHAGSAPVAGKVIHLPETGAALRLQARSLRVGDRPLIVISFVPETEPTDPAVEGGVPASTYDIELERLDRELRNTQETMRRSMAELETANEELQASSEELQASSEELQSSYEELETSNEELQATNEELANLNQRSRLRADQLEVVNTDLENIQASLSQGMVLVDRDLCITRYTPLSVRVFGLVPADVGKPLLGVPTTVPVPELDEALHSVINGGERRGLELLGTGVSYLAQVLPYQALDGRRLGAIITLTDVTELVRLREAMQTTLSEFTQVTDALDEVVWKRDTSMANLVYLSGRVLEMTGWTAAELLENPHALDDCIDDGDRAAVLAGRHLDAGRWTLSYRLNARDGGHRWIRESAAVIHDVDGDFVVGTMADITAQKAAEEEAARQSTTFEAVFNTHVFSVAIIDGDSRIAMANTAFCELVGYDASTVLRMPLMAFAHPDERADFGASSLLDPPRSPGDQVTTRHFVRSDGASRWVVLDLRPLPTPTDTATAVVIIQDVTELRDTTNLLSEQARFDAGTALVNRRAFREDLETEISRSQRTGAGMALAWVDLDRFKEVNDQHGHDVGDAVLRTVATRLTAVVRTIDVVGRIGGDEFGVLITGYERPTELEAALERMRIALHEPIAVEGGVVTISGSLGIAVYPADGATSDDLLRAADTAMYAAKAEGKDTYTYFDAGMNDEAEARRVRHRELTAAIGAASFEIHYQPIVSAKDGSVWGLEALLRWVRADEVVKAADFIPFCEDTGLIRALGPLTLSLLRRDLAALNVGRGPRLPVCFNMSVQQLEDRHLADLLTGWPSPTGLTGLVVEVTESVFLPGNTWAMDALRTFKQLGADISVDDYGSGYSNFSLLESLAPRYIKLDKSFLSDHAVSVRGVALLRSAIEMAHALDAIVIAEGIEEQAQLDLVTTLGADLIQGYAIAEPMPLPDILSWLADAEMNEGERASLNP